MKEPPQEPANPVAKLGKPKKVELSNLDNLVTELAAAAKKGMIYNHKLDCNDESGFSTVTFLLKPDAAPK